MQEITYGLGTVSNFKLLGFATGSYQCNCSICHNDFIGDKRAVMCLSCAIESITNPPTATEEVRRIVATPTAFWKVVTGKLTSDNRIPDDEIWLYGDSGILKKYKIE